MNIGIGARIACDVSSLGEELCPEIHRFGGRQQGVHLPDGSFTGGLAVTMCGIEQATRGHGWFLVGNEYQRVRIETGVWPVCSWCEALAFRQYCELLANG